MDNATNISISLLNLKLNDPGTDIELTDFKSTECGIDSVPNSEDVTQSQQPITSLGGYQCAFHFSEVALPAQVRI